MKDFVEKKGIKYLVHFTRLENLTSILEDGLIPRNELESSAINATFNDEHRYDNCKDALCCSVSHPNYKMFYSLRMENPDVEWCVLGIKKKVLWEKDCAFCIENAAKSSVTSIPLDERKGKDSLKKLFDEIDGFPARSELKIPDNFPTNPQAEILVFDKIEPDDIIGVCFQNEDRKNEYKKLYNSFKFIYNDEFFSYRKDYEHWR